MTTPATSQPRPVGPPSRRLRLLADLAPAFTVVFGLLTLWLVVTTLQNLAQPMSPAVIVALVLGTLAAVLAGSVTYRFAVEVPRILRGWQAALVERRTVSRNK
jgi:hypothetical protein